MVGGERPRRHGVAPGTIGGGDPRFTVSNGIDVFRAEGGSGLLTAHFFGGWPWLVVPVQGREILLDGEEGAKETGEGGGGQKGDEAVVGSETVEKGVEPSA
jgi:hypothetical protein